MSKKIYRFTQNAYFEQDFEADSLEEAEKLAQEAWHETYGYQIFGEPEFEGVVEDE